RGQKEIAKLTGVSQAKISRLLTEAREIGMVQIKVGHYDPRNGELEWQLVKKFGLKNVIAIRTWKKQDKELNGKDIGYFAAPIVADMIKPNSTVCIAAGHHISHLVDGMEYQTNKKGVSVLQAMGNITSTVRQHDAIEVGRKFAEKLEAKFYQLQAPAISSTPRERSIFIKHPQIQTVLQMAKNASLAITGIGTLESTVFREDNFLSTEDVKRLEKEGVVGEICSRFFDANGNQPDTKYRDCVIGISIEQLKAIPEVIAITSGVSRVNAILAAIRNKFIKSLITDEETAKALLESN
ncbi:MAG: hypothetical protein JW947_01830, partial [Sedimentisphaerales bacterium]|nr:hypothetical protein [Sedimentisphaerales bacterium]